MKAVYTIPVLAGTKRDIEEELVIEIDYDTNICSIQFGGSELCVCDWNGNLLHYIEEVLSDYNKLATE